MEWHRTTSPKKKPKTVPLARKVTGTDFWDSEGCILVGFLEKGWTTNAARYVQTLNKLRRALREKLPKENCRPFHMTMRGLTLHVWPCRQFKRTAGNCSSIHPTVRIWPLRLPFVWSLERSPERSPLRDWRGSSQGRVKLVARSWNGLLLQRHL
jgi:hypothetical protein